MAGELSAVVQDLFDALDKGDAERIVPIVASDAQGIDEISRKWIRGPGELVAFAQEILTSVDDVHSEMHDVHESDWGDSGLVTFWLEQDYALQGDRVHISAPTSVVLRRDQAGWQVVLWHSLPLEPEEGTG